MVRDPITAKDAKMNHLGAKMNQCMGALFCEFLINFQNEDGTSKSSEHVYMIIGPKTSLRTARLAGLFLCSDLNFRAP